MLCLADFDNKLNRVECIFCVCKGLAIAKFIFALVRFNFALVIFLSSNVRNTDK
jgi:hypothetical protein